MKLSTLRINQALEQLEPKAIAVPEDHPTAPTLHEIFGEHTFFLDADGLEIIEPVDAQAAQGQAENAGQVVRLAIWNDSARTTLAPHPAEATGGVVMFAPLARDRVDQAGEQSFPASDAPGQYNITGEHDA